MDKFSIPLSQALAVIAEGMLPAFSGQNKMLEIAIQMDYEKGRFQHVKVLFWRPNKYMMVAFSYETHLDDITDSLFEITANHDSTWKSDGLNFFPGHLVEPKDIRILSTKIVEIEDANADDTKKHFTFKRKGVAVF